MSNLYNSDRSDMKEGRNLFWEKMSLQGSPYSSHYHQDEYDFEDDKYHDYDIDRENDDGPHDESDEDTEEASETDMTNHEQPLEIKEQMYQDKLASLRKQLKDLDNYVHPEYNRRVRRLESQFQERLRLNSIYREYMMECAEREYAKETLSAAKELDEKKNDLRENILADLEEKRRMIEAERHTMELTGDSTEVKPVMTRKLRRRPNDPVPVQEKRRKPTTSQVVFLLDEKEVENDIKAISARSKVVPSPTVRKPVTVLSPTVVSPAPQASVEQPLVETRIEDGKLLFEKRWFHRGQSVYVEGKDMPRFPGNISAIATEAICVKKISDGSKVRIYLSQLSRGKVSIKRRAP